MLAGSFGCFVAAKQEKKAREAGLRYGALVPPETVDTQESLAPGRMDRPMIVAIWKPGTSVTHVPGHKNACSQMPRPGV